MAPPLQLHNNVVYTVSGHSHTLDMGRDMGMHCIRDRRPVRCASAGRDVTSIVAALHAFWPVDVQRGVYMCSMNTSEMSLVAAVCVTL